MWVIKTMVEDLVTYCRPVLRKQQLEKEDFRDFSLLSVFLLLRECGGSRIPCPLQVVRQLLAVINNFLLFQFKGLKCFLFVIFYPKIELSDSLFRSGMK